jgi:hypothetical protein
MTNLISENNSVLKFSKEYSNAFGSSRYLNHKIRISGVAPFGYSDRYSTILVNLDEQSTLNLTKISEDMGFVLPLKMNEYGTSINIKVKSEGAKSVVARSLFCDDCTVSVFTSNSGTKSVCLSV